MPIFGFAKFSSSCQRITFPRQANLQTPTFLIHKCILTDAVPVSPWVGGNKESEASVGVSLISCLAFDSYSYLSQTLVPKNTLHPASVASLKSVLYMPVKKA
jgi:hypothetical protein